MGFMKAEQRGILIVLILFLVCFYKLDRVYIINLILLIDFVICFLVFF